VIGLDTNALVRYIVQDGARQASAATRLIESTCTREDPGFISHLVLAELCWVLGRGYGYPRPTLMSVLSNILTAAELQVQDAGTVWQALRAFEAGSADFADYLIALVHETEGCEITYTFDRKAAKSGLHRLVN
jgi:predicted nucleic-acid-binding protein